MRKRLTLVATAITLVAAACGGGDGGAADTTVGDDGGAADTTAGETMDGVHTAESDLGSILVDGEGFTLYIFTADTEGESTCYDACADLWPPVAGDATISSDLDASLFGTTTREDGSTQLTVNGMPLYRYTPDSEPGDTTGQDFNGVWFVVDGEGTVIEAAAEDDNEVLDYGY